LPTKVTKVGGVALALQLTEVGLELRLQRHRREFPDAGTEELDAIARRWYRVRPGAEHGDVAGPIRVRAVAP